MKPLRADGRQSLLTPVFVGLAIGVAPLRAQPATGDQGTNEIRIAQVQLYVLDGAVQLSNAQGALSVTNNQQVTADLPGDDFWQVNFWVGYRFRRNVGDISVGLLNAAGMDYRLDPLNAYAELPREIGSGRASALAFLKCLTVVVEFNTCTLVVHSLFC